ncbi:unnamed protein product [Anisakis simplex]|uniref:Protein kinase domain-containing protein n=1 Tax=Anisakis simplex TaxID=6269 RepID=A0A0M3IYF0_ANISI|nr:unnamed protein product [Anisakis simplex]
MNNPNTMESCSQSINTKFQLEFHQSLKFGEHLGSGKFGSVYRGEWNTKGKVLTVALKKVSELQKEADILAGTEHPNIIKFYGVSRTAADFVIVTELAERGSLYSYLHDPKNPDLDFYQVTKWALQIASAVEYLHYKVTKRIIHRDLKSNNIVLTGEGDCKVCDFGRSKNPTHWSTVTSLAGTVRWMSPEMLLANENNKITIATDVWSYGIVLWEMLTREVPHKSLNELRVASLIADKHLTPVIPKKCPVEFKRLMKNCWKRVPEARHNMRQITDELNKMRKNAKLSRQYNQFIKHKNEWKCEIEDQSAELKAVFQNTKLFLSIAKRCVIFFWRTVILRMRVNCAEYFQWNFCDQHWHAELENYRPSYCRSVSSDSDISRRSHDGYVNLIFKAF